MSTQKYPFDVSIFKGEGRILVIPFINHIAGFSVMSDWYKIITNINDISEIGNIVLSALNIIEKSPLSIKGRDERDTWKKGSKYKGYRSFFKNNFIATVKKHINYEYEIYSSEKDLKDGGYLGPITRLNLPPTATAEELGKAVLDVLQAAEDFYANADSE